MRNKDGYQKLVYDFIKDVLVVCPGCKGKAIVKTNETHASVQKKESEIKLICLSCGYNKRLQEKPDAILHSSSSKIIKGKYMIVGGNIDPYFHQPLWLTIACCDNILWAFNYKHLDFLKAHVEAKLRERNLDDIKNRSLGSRLPRWMSSKKNRDAILKAISILRTK